MRLVKVVASYRRMLQQVTVLDAELGSCKLRHVPCKMAKMWQQPKVCTGHKQGSKQNYNGRRMFHSHRAQ